MQEERKKKVNLVNGIDFVMAHSVLLNLKAES